MDGSSMIDDGWENLTNSTISDSTMVLVGKTGNGKSATGNSILGKKVFLSQFNSSGVTSTCDMQSTTFCGRTINVIDTPGLFDFTAGSKEIVKCIDLAKEGIHAVLLVFSVRTRFSKEEEAVILGLQTLFGDRIIEYMIVVFTGGDDLEDDDLTLKDYIGCKCPEPLQDFLQLCKYRVVLFNNKTKDTMKRDEQVGELVKLVDSVVASNGGQPFSDQFFSELKEGALKLSDREKAVKSQKGYTEQQISELKDQMCESYDDQLARITVMVEQKLNKSIERLEKQLAKEQAARRKAEKIAEEARKASNRDIKNLNESQKRAMREAEEFRRRAEGPKCAIL